MWYSSNLLLDTDIYQSEWFQGLVKYLPEGQKWRLDAALIYGLVWVSHVSPFSTFPSVTPLVEDL